MDFGKARNGEEQKVCDIEKQIADLKQQVRDLLSDLPPEEIQNYELTLSTGEKTNLLNLFGDKDELILIHNMGPGCPYCTLWADGLSSSTPYIENRCSLWLETDIEPEKLADFSRERGWKFNSVSSANTSLKLDLGFQEVKGEDKFNWPGYSTLFKEGDKIYRHATSFFGPGDDYCAIWPMMDRLKKGRNGWQPQFNK